MATVKVRLRFPTVGAKRGDEIEVDKAEAEHLIANGSATAVKPAGKSDKD